MDSRISDFLKTESIALVGLSRDPESASRRLYKLFRQFGYAVYPVNPNASEIEGEVCYPDLLSLPEKPGAVYVMSPPDAAVGVLKQATQLGVSRIWLHEGGGKPAFDGTALRYCESHGLKPVIGECGLATLQGYSRRQAAEPLT